MADEVKRTHATYTQIATAYAAVRHDRSSIQTHLDRFIQLVPTGSTVLDVGCGPGFDTAVLTQHGYHAIGADLTHAMILAGREHGLNNSHVQADMRHLPFKQGSFDAIWACASLLHLPPSQLPITLNGFYHLLRPHGHLYTSIKAGQGTSWVDESYGQAAPRFFSYWQADTFDSLLQKSSFTVIGGWLDPTPKDSWLIRFATRNPHK